METKVGTIWLLLLCAALCSCLAAQSNQQPQLVTDYTLLASSVGKRVLLRGIPQPDPDKGPGCILTTFGLVSLDRQLDNIGIDARLCGPTAMITIEGMVGRCSWKVPPSDPQKHIDLQTRFRRPGELDFYLFNIKLVESNLPSRADDNSPESTKAGEKGKSVDVDVPPPSKLP